MMRRDGRGSNAVWYGFWRPALSTCLVNSSPMPVPANPRIFHICHVDRLSSIINEGGLLCDAEIADAPPAGTTIGMTSIKWRRLTLPLRSRPGLYVGSCVPFYFCPRSVMLYVISKRNHESLTYRGGQGLIIHLEADLRRTVAWAEEQEHRWAFTSSNAGSRYFDDFCDLDRLDEIDWDVVAARYWNENRDEKQAEFLIEGWFPWMLVSRIGVLSQQVYQQTMNALAAAEHRPRVEIKPEWYY